MKRVALLGDIHIYRLMTAPWRLLGKRLAGQANLWFSRRHRFQKSLIFNVLQRVEALKPDLLLLSGDLTTTALHSEFEEAATALRPIMSKIETVIVPGNHDRYTMMSGWARTAEKHFGRQVPRQFPHLRALNDRWALLAVDAAMPRAISSRGRVGRDQLARVRQLLAAEGGDPRSRGLIVLCHYPFSVPSQVHWPWIHRLADAEAVGELMVAASKEYGQLIYVHGHVHQPWWWQNGGAAGRLTVVNAGAPCCKNVRYPNGQGFWQLDLPDDPADGFELVHHVPSWGSANQWDVESFSPGRTRIK